MQASTIEAIRESIKSLEDFLGASDSSNEVYSREQRKRQDFKAVKWASENNLLIIEENDFLIKWKESGKIRGGENLVFFENGCDGMISAAIKMNTLLYHGNNLSEFVERLLISSEYFPDTTHEIIGMVKTKQGVKPLLRQEFVVTKPKVLACRVDISNALKEMGFQLLDPDNEIWLSPDHGYYLSDPGQNNVLVDENGDLAFIDVVFKKVSHKKLKIDYPKLDLAIY